VREGKSFGLDAALAAAWVSSQATFGPQKGTPMQAHRYNARLSSPSALAALDFGLRVRVEAHPSQRTIFSGAENLSVQELIAELSEMVSELRVRSFALRAELERVTSALLVNVECGFWPLASRAALDLGGLLASAGRRGLADRELCVRGSRCAFRIADLLETEVR